MIYIKNTVEFLAGVIGLKYNREDVATGKMEREKRFTQRIIASESIGARRLSHNLEEKDAQPDRQNHRPY